MPCMVRRNAQYYKPILNQFNIGQWVLIFDPRIIPGSCDKLRSYWAGPYKIIRLMAPVLAEVIAVLEQGKPRTETAGQRQLDRRERDPGEGYSWSD